MIKEKKRSVIYIIPIILLWAAIIAMMVVMLCGQAEGGERHPADLWRGLIGEAIGDGHAGMVAVCHVYKNRINRGMSMGCAALKRKDLDKFIAEQTAYGKRIGRDYEKEAKEIVKNVFNGHLKDPTGGADHYENTKAFGIPYWAPGMRITAKINSHTFYKER